MSRIFPFDLETLPYVIITIVVAFTIHEFAHAYVAYKFGDPTAKNQGRLTLNPIVHLDPMGTLLLVLAGFGWAKPVPVNRFFFKDPRLAGVLVSIAGPLSNLLLAIIGFFAAYTMGAMGVGGEQVYVFLDQFVYWNVLLFTFNLLPFPPLDGYRVIEDLVPNRVRPKLTQYEQYGSLLFLVLVIIPPLNALTIQPFFSIVLPTIFDGLNGIFQSIYY